VRIIRCRRGLVNPGWRGTASVHGAGRVPAAHAAVTTGNLRGIAVVCIQPATPRAITTAMPKEFDKYQSLSKTFN